MSSKLVLTLFLYDSERSGQLALFGKCESASPLPTIGNHVNISMASTGKRVRQTLRSIKVFCGKQFVANMFF